MAAINDSLKQNAAALPKDNQQLGDAVNKIVDARDKQAAKRKAKKQTNQSQPASKRQNTQQTKGAANRKSPPAGRGGGNGKPNARPPTNPHPHGNSNNTTQRVTWKRQGTNQKRNPKGTQSTPRGKK
jgi:hypothetical protein